MIKQKLNLKFFTMLMGIIFILSIGITAYMSVSTSSSFEYENEIDIGIHPPKIKWKTKIDKE